MTRSFLNQNTFRPIYLYNQTYQINRRQSTMTHRQNPSQVQRNDDSSTSLSSSQAPEMNSIKQQLSANPNSLESVLNSITMILSSHQHVDVVAWSQSGRAFSIKDKTRFVEEVLPLIFNHKNFPSFIRQMKGYGFKHLKRKEGLQFYLKGFSRGKSFGSLKYEVSETSIAMSESTGDHDNEQEQDLNSDSNYNNTSLSDMDPSGFFKQKQQKNDLRKVLKCLDTMNLINRLADNQKQRHVQLERSLNILDSSLDQNLLNQEEMEARYLQTSQRDLNERIALLERAGQALKRDMKSEKIQIKSGLSTKQSFLETRQQQPESSPDSKAQSDLLDDFSRSCHEDKQIKHRASFNQNESLHNQVMTLTDGMICRLSNYMVSQGLSPPSSVNQLLSNVSEIPNDCQSSATTTAQDVCQPNSPNSPLEEANQTDYIARPLQNIQEVDPCQLIKQENNGLDKPSNMTIYMEDDQDSSAFQNGCGFQVEKAKTTCSDLLEEDYNWRLADFGPSSYPVPSIEEEEMDIDSLLINGGTGYHFLQSHEDPGFANAFSSKCAQPNFFLAASPDFFDQWSPLNGVSPQ